jgi:hypothetical protein
MLLEFFGEVVLLMHDAAEVIPGLAAAAHSPFTFSSDLAISLL